MNLPVPFVHEPELVEEERERNDPVLTFSPHPLLPEKDRLFLYTPFVEGETLEGYLRRAGIFDRMANQPFIIRINGYRVPREMWSRCYPHSGTIINVCAIVRGGGGGGEEDDNKLPRMIGLIAIIVLSYYTFGVGGYAGLTGWASAAAVGASIVVGQIVITRMFPLPKPPKGPAGESPSFAVGGGSNSMRRYEPMPIICGTHKVFPDFGAQPYTEFLGDDQVAYYIFDFGYNNVDLSDMRIGETPITDYTGVVLEQSDYSGVLYSFPGNVDSIEGATITVAAGPVTRTSSLGSTSLAVEVTGNLFAVTDKGNLAYNEVVIKIECSPVGQNQWVPITFADDFINNLYTSNAFVWLATRNLLAQQRAALGPGAFVVANDNRKLVRRTFKWAVPLGQYDVRVSRITGDSIDPKNVNDLVWTQLRSYQPDLADYTGRKRLAMRITASGQLNGHVQQFNCIASAKCPVWQGLSSKGKVGLFMPGLLGMGWNVSGDDTFLTQATSNPAWWYLDAIRGRFTAKAIQNIGAFMPDLLSGPWSTYRKVYGAGQPDVRTDLDNIKAFAAWCDAQALTFNFVFDQQSSVYDVIKAIALSGRGTPSWGTGKLGVIWDQPSLPVTAVFGMHNIIPNTFEISYSVESLADVVEAWFINPALNWQKDFIRVQVPGTITQNNVRRVELQGRTSRTLAAEDANLYAAQTAYRNRRYKWQTDWEGMPSSRGDVIQISHDLASLDYSGRFADSTTRRDYFVDLKSTGVKVTTPHAPIQLSQTLDIRAKWRALHWLIDNDTILDKTNLAGQHSYYFETSPSGGLGFQYSTNGSNNFTLNSTVTVPFGNGVLGYVRVTFQADRGDGQYECKFYTSNDNIVWTQLGATLNGAAVTLFPGTSPLIMGTASGQVFWVEVRNAINSDAAAAMIAHFDASYGTPGNSIVQVPNPGNTWTINAPGVIAYDAIPSGSESSLKLSRQVPLYSAGAFIVIVKPDGSVGTYNVKGGAGSTDVLTPVNPLPFNPWSNDKFVPYDYRWHYGPSSTPGKKLKIDSFKPVSERLVEIEAIDELDYFYTAKTNPYSFTTVNNTLGALTLKSVLLSVDGVRAGTGYIAVVTVHWDVEGDYDHADVQLSLNGNPSTAVATGERTRSTSFTVIDGSEVEVTVTVYSSLGLLGQTSTSTTIETINFASLGPPGDVESFSLAGDTFSWTTVADVDVIGYQIRFFVGETGSSWDIATPLHDGVLTDTPWTPKTMPKGRGPITFLIKAVDAAGIYSLNPAIVVKDLGDLSVDNVVLTIDLGGRGWTGVLTGGSINGSNHLVADTTTFMWNADSGIPMWSLNPAAPMWSVSLYKEMSYYDYVDIPGDEADFPLNLEFTGVGSPLTVEYRDNTNAAMWVDSDDADMIWLATPGPAVPSFMAGTEGMLWNISDPLAVPAFMPYLAGWDWDYMWAPFGDFKPWIGQINSQSTVYEFQFTTGQGTTQGELDSAIVTIDVPDITQLVKLLQVPAAGIRVALTEAFRAITVVNITLQHVSTSRAVSAKWLDKDIVFGPLIQCFDASNTPTDGVVNVLIEGY